MLTICCGAKGGSGTSVTSAALALTSDDPSVVVDTTGVMPLVLGVAEPDTPGLFDWFSSEAPATRLTALEVPLTEDRSMIGRGTLTTSSEQRWRDAADVWALDDRHIIVDAGTNPPTNFLDVERARKLLVTRPCYLAVRAAIDGSLPIDGVILIDEPGRSLRAPDIESALGVPVVTTLLIDPAVARAVDAGLLLGRLPRGMRRQLRQVLR